MTRARKTRWAILGPGLISRDFAVGVRDSSHGTLHAIASSQPERAAAFAREHGAAASGGYDEILAREDVDAVYIGTVHTTHADLAIRALEAGKAVLCEKPASPTREEVDRILDVAARARRPFLEAFKTRFGPFADALRSLVASGELGELRGLIADRGFVAETRTGRLFDPALAGGAVLDVGCYPLALAVDLAAAAGLAITQPEIIEVAADRIGAVEASSAVRVRFASFIASISASIERRLPASAVIRFSQAEVLLPDAWGSRTGSASTIIVRSSGKDDYYELPVVQPMSAEADAISIALAEGRVEVPEMPWSHSRVVARTLTDWRALAGG